MIVIASFVACDIDFKYFIERMEHDTKLSVEWFENNYMKLNQDQCHLLEAGDRYETLWANIKETRIWESKNEKL